MSSLSAMGALQATLAGEHAAVFVYGALGGRTSAAEQATLFGLLTSAYTTHRARRDQLVSMVRDAGGEPVAAELGYQLTGPVQTPRQVRTAARDTETRAAEVYAQLVTAGTGPQREWAVTAHTDAAVRLLGFGGQATAFPGLPELP